MKYATLAAILIAAPAFGQTVPADHRTDAKKIPWQTVMMNEDGKPFVDHCTTNPIVLQNGTTVPGVGCVDLTLARAVAHVLYVGMPGEKPDGDVDYPRSILAHEIDTNPPDELTTDQAVTVKKLLGANYPTIIIGQVFPILFPNDKPGAIR